MGLEATTPAMFRPMPFSAGFLMTSSISSSLLSEDEARLACLAAGCALTEGADEGVLRREAGADDGALGLVKGEGFWAFGAFSDLEEESEESEEVSAALACGFLELPPEGAAVLGTAEEAGGGIFAGVRFAGGLSALVEESDESDEELCAAFLGGGLGLGFAFTAAAAFGRPGLVEGTAEGLEAGRDLTGVAFLGGRFWTESESEEEDEELSLRLAAAPPGLLPVPALPAAAVCLCGLG